MNKETADMWSKGEQATLAKAYQEMHRQDAAKREEEIAKMLDIVGGTHSVDRIVEKLYDAGYRKRFGTYPV